MEEPGSAAQLTEVGMAERIRVGAGVPGLEPRIERTGTFSFARR